MTDKKPVRPVRLPALKYVGPAHLSGIPARDLSPSDLERLAHDPYVSRRLAKTPRALADLLCSVTVDGHPIYRAAPAATVTKE